MFDLTGIFMSGCGPVTNKLPTYYDNT